MCELLGVFNYVLIVLEGDGQLRERVNGTVKAYGLIWNVVFAYKYMLEALEKAKNNVINEANASRWKTAVNQAWSVLNKYYDVLDECPVYYASMALHPRWRWHYFKNKWSERPDWVAEAKRLVRELWLDEYKIRPVSDNATAYITSRVKDSFLSPFDQYRDPHTGRFSSPFGTEPEDIPTDEYDRWQLDKSTECDIDDPLQYWYQKRSEYPRLAQMAAEILSVQPMSAECERLFSSGGLMVSPLRTRLEATTIGIAQTLRSWLKAGLIEDSVMGVKDLNTKNYREEGSEEDVAVPQRDSEDEEDEATEATVPWAEGEETPVTLDD